jgi:hypothetical protein
MKRHFFDFFFGNHDYFTEINLDYGCFSVNLQREIVTTSRLTVQKGQGEYAIGTHYYYS